MRGLQQTPSLGQHGIGAEDADAPLRAEGEAADVHPGEQGRELGGQSLLHGRGHDPYEAPWLLDGPMHGERFGVSVQQVLVPTLRPDDLVIMDNLSSHKSAAVRRATRQAGAKPLLLPQYSPDLNPSEQVFAKLKHLMRKAAARTQDAVCSTIGILLDTYTPQECADSAAHSGYGQK
ncbi:transposase [Siccirubricoccus sp. G192]|nr:transposase [Siccirubricoccus sp. G192]